MEDTSASPKNSTLNNNLPESSLTNKDAGKTPKKNNTVRYILIFLGIVAVLAGIFIGYSLLKKTPNNTPLVSKPVIYSGPIEKIVLGNFTGVYSLLNLIANEKGYFKENGLDVHMTEYDTAPPEMDALLAGKVDVAIASDFTGVRYIFTNDNLRILTQISKQDVFQLIARKSNGIVKVADLKGKKIGVTKKSVGEFFLGQYLTFNNISLPDVTIVNLPSADIVTQLDAGKIDAGVLYDPLSYNLIKKLGNDALVLPVQNDQKVFAISYTTEKFIKEHPYVLQRYLRALMQAEQFTKNNELETKSFIAKTFKYDDAYIEYVWPKINFDLRLEQALLLTLEGQANFSIDNKLTDKTKVPNYLNFIYVDALQKIRPDAITIIK